ncbi:MAG TPA: hypothetical protein VHZ24_01860 [Pirellulales bacterium]|nr:hypothetical protein [Pirellulales bacterium]
MSAGTNVGVEEIIEALRQRGRMRVSELNAVQPDIDKLHIALVRLRNDGYVSLLQDDVVLRLSSQEQTDLERLEVEFEKGQRDSITALRQIREGKLYRERYSNFDEYMAGRWGRTRQWATQQINWLRRLQLLEERGKGSYQLTVDDAQVLGPLEEEPECFVRAIEEADDEARRLGKRRNKKMLQAAVERQTAFVNRRQHSGFPADLSYEEFRSLERLGTNRRLQPDLLTEARQKSEAESRPLADCLTEVCGTEQTFPSDERLLAVARGEVLDNLVTPLIQLSEQWQSDKELEEQRKKLQRLLDEVETKLKPKLVNTDESDDEEKDDGEDAEPGKPADERLSYEVRLTGDFAVWAAEWSGIESGQATLDETELQQMLQVFADLVGDGGIGSESSITVKPIE